jgi:hypothetical protein
LFFFQRLDALISEEEKRYMLKCEGIRGFHEELYNIGFLLVINWMSWLNQNEVYKNRANDIEEPVMKADLDTLRKLMKRYIRGDIQRHNNKRTCNKNNRLANDMVTNIGEANF